MKKQSKWLLVGSLMCLVVGSGFHQGYGMKRNLEPTKQLSNKEQKTKGIDLPDEMILYIMTFLDPKDVVYFGATCKGINRFSADEGLWKQKAFEHGISKVELEKVEKEFFSYQQIVIGYAYWNKFDEVRNEKKLNLLMQAAVNGNEEAISCLLDVYQEGLFGLQEDDPEGLVLAEKYADLRSEKAIGHLLDAHLECWYGLQQDDPEGLEVAQKYADQGSEEAIWHLLHAYLYSWHGLEEDDPKGLVLAEKYADLGSEVAKRFLNENKWRQKV